MTIDWTSVITALVAAIVAAGGIGGVFYFRENKRAKQLENDTTASAQWRELYAKMEERHDALSLKLDASYKENKLLRDDNNNLTTQNAVLKIWKCDNITCADRRPPFGSKTETKTNDR